MADAKLLKLNFYAAKGWGVFPLQWMNDGVCSCGDAGCDSPGKHPLTSAGFYDATTDMAKVKAWHKQFPHANWGLRTGASSGVGVVDIDPRHGGDATWEALRTQHPEPIETVQVATGGGGTHYYFSLNGAGALPCKLNLFPGIDLKSDLGYVLIPPSKTTNEYKIQNIPKGR